MVTDNVCLVINIYISQRAVRTSHEWAPYHFGKHIAREGASRPPVSALDQPMRIEIYDSKITVYSGVAITKVNLWIKV